jgi:hypothetical protein
MQKALGLLLRKAREPVVQLQNLEAGRNIPKKRPLDLAQAYDMTGDEQVLVVMSVLDGLGNLDGVSVIPTGYKNGTITIDADKHHVLQWKFQWIQNRFLGYALKKDDSGGNTVANVVLRSPEDALRFVGAYTLLYEIRANQKN